jgi:hypothetical protein
MKCVAINLYEIVNGRLLGGSLKAQQAREIIFMNQRYWQFTITHQNVVTCGGNKGRDLICENFH